MFPDSLSPYAGALLALAVSLIWALLLRGRGWVALALPLAALAGFFWVMGGFSASPRQLPERLPLLAVAGLVAALPLVPRGWMVAWVSVLAGLGTGWWMAGAPMTEADLRRVLPVALVLALLVPVLHREAAGPWRAQAAVLALAAGLWAAGAFGPWLILSLVLLGAALPLLLAGAAMPDAARLPLVMLLVALLASPVLTRGAPQDWAAALAPLAVLLLAPRIRGGQGLLVMLLCGAVPVGVAWLLAR